jgi:Ni,Fe-hydrogenase III large subunit
MTATLATLLSGCTALPGHRPWPRYDIDADTWHHIGEAMAAGECTLLGLWGDAGVVHMAVNAPSLPTPCVVTLAIRYGTFPSIGRHHPPAIRLERTVCDLYGYKLVQAPDTRAWLDHGAWGMRAPLAGRAPAPLADPVAYDFARVEGHGLHQIPVGPVHAGIIEPGHFRFTANGEIVARLEERLGYVHKGIDALLTDCDLERAGRIVARVSGDSTVAASFAFTRAVEAALDCKAPPRAQALRGVMAELERIANHLGDIGAVCNDAAFSLILAYCGILREKVLAASDRVFGHRLMMDRVVPGGVDCDLARGDAETIVAMLDDIAPVFADVVEEFDDTPSLQDRTCATGVVDAGLVALWGAGGHVGRASGRDFDARRDLAYAPYDGLAVDVPVFTAGDVDARVRVRIREVQVSCDLVRRLLDELPAGPVRAALPEAGSGEGVAVTEAFRGDLLVWLRLDDGRIARCHVRDASWFQWPLLEASIENNIVADFPLCNKSFNCSYSGHDL